MLPHGAHLSTPSLRIRIQCLCVCCGIFTHRSHHLAPRACHTLSIKLFVNWKLRIRSKVCLFVHVEPAWSHFGYVSWRRRFPEVQRTATLAAVALSALWLELSPSALFYPPLQCLQWWVTSFMGNPMAPACIGSGGTSTTSCIPEILKVG